MSAETPMVCLLVAPGDEADLALDAREVERMGAADDAALARASLHESVGFRAPVDGGVRVLWVRDAAGERAGIRVSGTLVIAQVPAPSVLSLPDTVTVHGSPVRSVVLSGERPVLVLSGRAVAAGARPRVTQPSSG